MRSPGQKTILLLLAVLAALLVAGCGGGGDETTDSTAATTTEEPEKLSKAELIEQGDGICAETNAAVGALDGTETEASSEQDEKVANLYTGMVERLQELGAPDGDEAGYSSFMEAAEMLAKVEGEVKLAAEREDIPALEEANTESALALEEFQEQAADYGFEDCSEGPGALTPAPGGETAPEAGGEELEGFEEEGGVEPEAEYVEPEYEEAPPEEVAPETGGAGGGAEVAPETGGGESGGGSESGGVGPG
ncbi:MAG TPA: hypothetical protein VFX35_10910 [Solirubrobacterales bacterium]|nr:hypothetical protein [Solirubrobacterales bacterium]